MKVTLTYGSAYELVIHTRNDETFQYDFGNGLLQDVIDFCETIFSDETIFRSSMIEEIIVRDSNTGEILAECSPDVGPTEVEDDYPNDCDYEWNFNEDLGFDPYLGCYTDDC